MFPDVDKRGTQNDKCEEFQPIPNHNRKGGGGGGVNIKATEFLPRTIQGYNRKFSIDYRVQTLRRQEPFFHEIFKMPLFHVIMKA